MITPLLIADRIVPTDRDFRADAAGTEEKARAAIATLIVVAERLRNMDEPDAALRAARLALMTLRCAAGGANGTPKDSANPAVELHTAQPRDIEIYDGYFGLVRVDHMSARAAAIAAIPLFVSTLFDLGRLPLSPDYSAYLVDLMSRMIQRGYSLAIPEQPLALHSSGALRELPIAAHSQLERWKYGHQLYGLANRNAADRVGEAVGLISGGDYDPAATALDAASLEVSAVVASLNYSAAMSSRCYIALVRPTMSPPRIEIELTGGMNDDHRAYRDAVDELLVVCDGAYDTVAQLSSPMAAARDRLLQWDLHDLQCHVELTYRLVGDVAALDEPDDGSAVQALRSLQVERTQRYSKLMRLGTRTYRRWCPDPSAHDQSGKGP